MIHRVIQNIVFDMGNVLILYDANRYVQQHIPDEQDQALVLDELFYSVEWLQLDRGCITEEQALAAVCARLPAHLHEKTAFLLQNWHQDIPAFPEMEGLIARLKHNGYHIYLLSNTSKKYHSFRRHIPALVHFEGEFISADWGLLKPDAAIFHAFCQHFSLVPAQCFFIDDAPANIESARRTGMHGFVYRRNQAKLIQALEAAGVNTR